MTNHSEVEFSRPFSVADLREEEDRRVEASEDERLALAGRFDVVSISALSADLKLSREMGAVIRLTGGISADVTQSCVVTLEPVETHFEIDVNCRFAPPEVVQEMVAEQGEEEVSFEEEDPPEMIEGGVIDLGETVAELLALEIDPFPRAKGAEFSGFASGPEGEGRKESPFAALEGLVKKPK